jgi:hypothetical protein
MTSRLFVAVHSIALLTLLTLTCFTPHSNDMTSWQNSSEEKISCNVAPFFYHHSVVIQHFVSDTLYQTCYFFASDTAFPTDETWYKQLYIHIVYIIRLSNVFMIKHKKNHVSFIEFIIIIIEFIIIIYYILSSNKGIFVWPIWPEVNCPYVHTPGK